MTGFSSGSWGEGATSSLQVERFCVIDRRLSRRNLTSAFILLSRPCLERSRIRRDTVRDPDAPVERGRLDPEKLRNVPNVPGMYLYLSSRVDSGLGEIRPGRQYSGPASLVVVRAHEHKWDWLLSFASWLPLLQASTTSTVGPPRPTTDYLRMERSLHHTPCPASECATPRTLPIGLSLIDGWSAIFRFHSSNVPPRSSPSANRWTARSGSFSLQSRTRRSANPFEPVL